MNPSNTYEFLVIPEWLRNLESSARTTRGESSATHEIQEEMISGSQQHEDEPSPNDENEPLEEEPITDAMCHGLRMMLWNGLTKLAPCIKVLHEQKRKHMEAAAMVRRMCHGVNWTDPRAKDLLKEPFFTAARLGNSEFVKEIVLAYNDSVYWENSEGHTVFHIAVLYRRLEVFNLVHSLGFQMDWSRLKDRSGNNFLHFTAGLATSSEVVGAAPQLQQDLLWFKVVENLVQNLVPSFREAVNQEKETPKAVFTKNRSELVKEAGIWMERTGSSCSFVATLIIGVVFAAAFTVLGDNYKRGEREFLLKQNFIVFLIFDGLALFFSVSSVLMFLGVRTSHFSEDDFWLSLPLKLIIGHSFLSISIGSMTVAYASTIYLAISCSVSWIIIPILFIFLLPLILFGRLQFTYWSDFCPNTRLALSLQIRGLCK